MRLLRYFDVLLCSGLAKHFGAAVCWGCLTAVARNETFFGVGYFASFFVASFFVVSFFVVSFFVVSGVGFSAGGLEKIRFTAFATSAFMSSESLFVLSSLSPSR